MQPSARTPSSILRKRQSQEEQNRRKSLRAKGRRVSFAPDDELETRHLFSIDKGSPALPPSQDTQPLGELQNQMPPPAAPHDPFGAPPAAAAVAGGKWGPGPAGGDQDHLLVRPQHNSLQQPEAFLLSPEPAGTPQSMDLTNDTTQNTGGIGGFPGFSLRGAEDDSIEFGGAGHPAGGGDMHGGAGFFAGRDGTYNITGDVPKLSALLEEDEEGDETRGTSGSDNEAESEGVAMELTGNTAATTPAAAAAAAASQEVTPGGVSSSPHTRCRSRSSAAADGGAAPAASPAVSPAPRRSTRRSSTQQDTTPPSAAAAAAAAGASASEPSPARSTPRGRARRSTSAAAADAAAPAAQQDGTPQPLVSPRRGRSSSAAAAAASVTGSALKGPAPSLDPTPSPLRRITRSMASPLLSPMSGGAGDSGSGGTGGSGGSLEGLTEGFTDKLLAGMGLAGAGAGSSAGGGGGSVRGTRRSSVNRFAEQQSRWGFVPGEEDTLNLNMNVPGAGGLGDTTLHHVYSDSAGTGELTASMKPGQHTAAAAAAAGGGSSSVGLRAGGRRRSSVGRSRARASLAAEAIPEEEAATPQPPAAAAEAAAGDDFDDGGAAAAAAAAAGDQEGDAAEPAAGSVQRPQPHSAVKAAAAAATPVRGGAGAGDANLTQDMDLDTSMGLGGATPGLLGDPHFIPMQDWRQQQQQQHLYDAAAGAAESPSLGAAVAAEAAAAAAAGEGADADADGMDVDEGDADENAPPGSPGGPSLAGAAAGAGGGGADVDGLTTNLLLDDQRQLPGWGHVALGGAGPRASLGGAGGLTTHTGRGSVGSNVLTMHTHRFGHTTQLLADSAALDDLQHAAPAAPAAAAGASHGQFRVPHHSTTPAGAGAGTAAIEDCTTKLLADSTSASACGIMGMLPQPRVGHLLSTIAGGAPVLHPTAGPFGRNPLLQQQEQDQDEQEELEQEEGQGYAAAAAAAAQSPYGVQERGYQMSPELGSKAAGRGLQDTDMVEDSQPDADAAAEDQQEQQQQEEDGAGEPSPVEHWNQPRAGSQGPAGFSAGHTLLPGASPAMAAAAAAAGQSPGLVLRQPSPLAGAVAAVARGCSREGDEPTLELAAGVTAGMTGLPGQSLLEDATLEDFALPPEMGAAAAEERPITMPFSGALASATGTVAHTPGGSVVRAAQPLTFSDFCQVVDMQFLTHIRRGTSISVCDFAPSSLPQDLRKALELLSITSCEVSVLEGAMHDLQAEMHNKRREAYEQEDRLGTDNPPVFATVQTSRPTQLEQTKHCLVLHKKACRSQTASSWKALRLHMEQQLADKLAQQQADLDEQLAFVQAKLQKAQQQREYAKAFHADVLKKLAAEGVVQQEAAAARARLVCLRNRLAELCGLNADRQQRAAELQERVAETEAKRAELGSELASLRARREQLAGLMASTPKPAASRRVLQRLQQVSEQVQLLQSLQGCKLVGDAACGYLLSLQGLLGVRLSFAEAAAGGSNSSKAVSGSLVLLPQDAAGAGAGAPAQDMLKMQLLREMVPVLQSHCSFACEPPLLREAVTEAEAVAGRALDLAAACQEVYLAQPLLTGVAVQAEGCVAGVEGGDVGAVLMLTLVEPDQRVKVQVALNLRDMLAHAHPGTRVRAVSGAVSIMLAQEHRAGLLQARLQEAIGAAVEGPYRLEDGSVGVSQAALLTSVCEATVKAMRA